MTIATPVGLHARHAGQCFHRATHEFFGGRRGDLTIVPPPCRIFRFHGYVGELLGQSDRKRLADCERQMTEMAELAGGLAHELRNPLSTMMLNLRLLAEDLRNTENHFEDVRRRALLKLDVLQSEAERLQSLFDEFLSLTGPVKFDRRETRLSSVIDRLARFFEPLATSKGIVFRVIGAESPVRCDVDEKQLNQALLNLLVNAQEAMPDGGTLEVRLSVDGLDAVVEVSDTGIGIDAEDRARVFRPFYSNKSGGTGLGLSLTRRIVQEHGGSLDFHSEPGRGTTFRLQLPVKNGQDSTAAC